MIKKLNLGCGFDKRDDYINADNFPECNPDILLEIENTPWDISDNQFDTVLLKHVLEHVGADFKKFASIMRELYRITSPNGVIEIHVPYYRHSNFWSDPTHVRAFTPTTFKMMSKKQNDVWIKNKANYTMLAYLINVDFEVIEARQFYDGEWWLKFQNGEISLDKLRESADQQWGVVKELRFKLRVVKELQIKLK